jgi:uncharacterized protein (DUF362 family)
MVSEVLCRRTGDRKAFVRDVLARFSGEFSGKRVFVKPNIVSYEGYPTTTHPDLLEACLAFLQGSGCETGVGDGPAIDAGKPHRVIEDHPLNAVCSRFDVELINLHECRFAKRKAGRMGIRVSCVPFEYDFLLSLPVLKCHPHTGMTGALKNAFGYLQSRERMLMHAKLRNIHRGIASLNLVLKPHLTIMDCVHTYRRANEVRHGGVMAELGYMAAGSDPVALDCLGLDLLGGIDACLRGKGWKDVEHIRFAEAMGAGSASFRRVDI